MTKIGTDEGLGKRFPTDFPLFEIGHNLLIKEGESDKGTFYQIVNRSELPNLREYDSNWLISDGNSYNIGDVSEWLETTDSGSLKTILSVSIGFYTDRPIDIKMRMPQSQELYGAKGQTDVWLTPEDSPIDEPKVWFWTFGDTYIPSFEIENNSGYTPNTFEIGARGYKYALREMDEAPSNYHTIVLSQIRGGM